MANRCDNCIEKCPQAERAHQASLGRMYATKEFTALLKKVESGELVEVVRCKDCKSAHIWKHAVTGQESISCLARYGLPAVKPDDFCSYGERREGE